MQTTLEINGKFSQRLNVFMKSKGFHNPNQLGHYLGYKNSEKISRLFRGTKHRPSYHILRDLCKKFSDLNIHWLLTGTGSMLNSTSDALKREEHHKDCIPLYDQFTFSQDAEGQEEKHETSFGNVLDFIPKKFVFREIDVATYVHGNSMSPQFMPGDIIFLKHLANRNFIHYGHLYVVVTLGYRALRYVMEGEEKHLLKLRSCNEHHKDMEVERAGLLDLYKVQGVLRKLDL